MSDNEILDAYKQIIEAQRTTINSLLGVIDAQNKTLTHQSSKPFQTTTLSPPNQTY